MRWGQGRRAKDELPGVCRMCFLMKVSMKMSFPSRKKARCQPEPCGWAFSCYGAWAWHCSHLITANGSCSARYTGLESWRLRGGDLHPSLPCRSAMSPFFTCPVPPLPVPASPGGVCQELSVSSASVGQKWLLDGISLDLRLQAPAWRVEAQPRADRRAGWALGAGDGV